LVSYSTATIELYTLSLHHALPISRRSVRPLHFANQAWRDRPCTNSWTHQQATRFFSCPIKSSDCRQHSRFPGLCQRWRLLRKPSRKWVGGLACSAARVYNLILIITTWRKRSASAWPKPALPSLPAAVPESWKRQTKAPTKQAVIALV